MSAKALALATDRFSIVNDLLVESVNPVNASFWCIRIRPITRISSLIHMILNRQSNCWMPPAGRIAMAMGRVIRTALNLYCAISLMTGNCAKMCRLWWSSNGVRLALVLKLENYSSDVFWNGFNDNGPQAQGIYDIAEYSSVGSFPDPEASSNWLCDQISSADNPDGANWQGYCDPKMDELLKEQASTLDIDKRIDLYKQIQQKMYDEVLYIGMWKDPDLWSVNSRLQNVKLAGATPFWELK